MIITRIDGGLGNQMFQYAYGMYLAERNGTDLCLDTSAYNSAPQHGYLLDKLRISAPELDESLHNRVPARYRSEGAASSLAERLGLEQLLGSGKTYRHRERPFGFAKKHLAVKNERYVVGYWQSEKFFPGMRERLCNEFQLAKPLSVESERVASRICASNSAAIHVRRGDYITNPSASQIYENLPIEYYEQCLEQWAAGQDNCEVFVFSNDIAWCQEHINLRWPITWVDHNTNETAHEDLFLMSQAACCVTANSTFSWWAGWLNQRTGHTVFAPKRWFKPGTLDDRHLACEGWKIVDATETAVHGVRAA